MMAAAHSEMRVGHLFEPGQEDDGTLAACSPSSQQRPPPASNPPHQLTAPATPFLTHSCGGSEPVSLCSTCERGLRPQQQQLNNPETNSQTDFYR